VAALIEARRPKKKGERVDGQIGSSQEAIVTFTGSAAALEPLRKVQPALLEFLIVSDIEFRVGDTTDASGLDIEVTLASTARCERCWNHRESVGQHVRFKTLCHRCVAVVERAGF
jgi:isoleucyl-tRNA synthetase